MINAELRVRCISPAALDAILELLQEESNAIFIETFETQEAPRTGTRAAIIRNRPNRAAGDRLGTQTRPTRRRQQT